MKLFSYDTFDSITSSLSKITEKLRQHAESNNYDAAAKRQKSDDLQEQACDHVKEANRASLVADKIEGLLK